MAKANAKMLALTRRLNLHYVTREQLTIERRRTEQGGFTYWTAEGGQIDDPEMLRRFASLAVPPAYENVRYSRDARAHLQAVGRDATGRLQYRYHPDWQKIREATKAKRLAALATVMPRIRRAITQYLSSGTPTREFVLAAAIELVGASAIRPGSEEYVKQHGTRGALTLLKSNVRVSGDTIALVFRGKGGKEIDKEFTSPKLAAAIPILRSVPGPRLFQYRTDHGEARRATAKDVNAFLREIAGTNVSLKDFRTLSASAAVLENLARIEPATSERKRRKQVLEAVKAAAEDLANTPAVCRKSYVHDAVVSAFEKGRLENFAAVLKSRRSRAKCERFLAQVVASSGAQRVGTSPSRVMSARSRASSGFRVVSRR
jgi:DNA topoisomerase-1